MNNLSKYKYKYQIEIIDFLEFIIICRVFDSQHSLSRLTIATLYRSATITSN